MAVFKFDAKAAFALGLAAGLLLAVPALLFLRNLPVWSGYAAARLGQLADRDILYLRNGDVMTGRVVSETPQAVMFEIPKGTAEFNRSDIEKLEENYNARFLKETW